MSKVPVATSFKGAPICAGIAIGKPFFFTIQEDRVPEFTIAEKDLDGEVARYRRALRRAMRDVNRLKKQLESEGVDDGSAILETHLQLMQDPVFTERIGERIRETRRNAEFVFHIVVGEVEEKFKKLSDEFFRERFKDIVDISRRVMDHLRESVRVSLADIPHGSIVFASDLAPSDAAEAKVSAVAAFVTKSGGVTSHAAIMAKAKGIPYVASVDMGDFDVKSDAPVIVDGRTGDVIINPSEEVLEKYRAMQAEFTNHYAVLEGASRLPAETFDGIRVRLSANIENIDEVEQMHQFGGSGVGLFRSEFIFLAKESFPSEEEQFLIYRKLAEKMQGLPAVIRTFDVGGDKTNGELIKKEVNPFLGCRAIRFMLKEKDIFKTQLRAILRASAFGDISIMFPMISGLPELLESKALIEEAKRELVAEGIPFGEKLPVGCMIEVPSAAIISDILAKEADFFSIGTNDLVQYSLAVDRGSQAVSPLYSPTHPSVIRLIRLVVTEANRHGIPVTVCGEVAADPRFTALLLGLGVHELSVAARYIPVIKNAVRNTSIVDATKLAEEALRLSTAYEIQDLLNEAYHKSVPEDSYFN